MYGLTMGDSLFEYEETSRDVIRDAIHNFLIGDGRNTVRCKSVIGHSDPIGEFKEINHRFDRSRVTVTEEVDHYRIELDRVIERSDIEGGERTVSGDFAFIQHENSKVWTAITGHGRDFFERGVEWLVDQSAPEMTEFYATSGNLEVILDKFSESLGVNTEVLVDLAVTYTQDEEATISFERQPYSEAFDEARKKGDYVDNVWFEAVRREGESYEDGSLIEAAISRDGVTQLSAGNVSVYFDELLHAYVREGEEKAELFSDKERSRETGELNEINLNFEEPVFQTPNDNKQVIEALADLKKAGVAVYHNNPYLHLSVLDFIDGSSVDVMVTDANTISIIPSYQGSLNSLMRISDRILKEYDEGEISVGEPQSRSFGDFFSG